MPPPLQLLQESGFLACASARTKDFCNFSRLEEGKLVEKRAAGGGEGEKGRRGGGDGRSGGSISDSQAKRVDLACYIFAAKIFACEKALALPSLSLSLALSSGKLLPPTLSLSLRMELPSASVVVASLSEDGVCNWGAQVAERERRREKRKQEKKTKN